MNILKQSVLRCRGQTAFKHHWTLNGARSSFVDYFKENGHVEVKSASTIPRGDTSTLFTSSGVNQFKGLLLGNARAELSGLKRIANSQRCVRVGGKHNDFEAVGRDSYHHTFFEMLGNWSFGDYFKKEACTFALKLLLDVYQLDEKRLYFTYFAGDLVVPRDEETRQTWLDLGISDDNIIACGVTDNFWDMGCTGPCGPCSEIHYDKTGAGDSARLVNAGTDDVVELWNLVFMEYNKMADGALVKLPAANVDTGMGLERLSAILQGCDSNYDIDVFKGIISELEKYTGSCKYLSRHDSVPDVCFRIIADHLRFLVNVVADGGFPGSHGRGHVITKVIKQTLMCSENLGIAVDGLCQLIPAVSATFSVGYPTLMTNRCVTTLQQMLINEVDYIRRNMKLGKKYINRVAKDLAATDVFPVSHATNLYRRYGLRPDMCQMLCNENGVSLDISELRNQIAGLRCENVKTKSSVGVVTEDLKVLLRGIPSTDDSYKYCVDLDELDQLSSESYYLTASVVAVLHDNRLRDSVLGNLSGHVVVITTRSNFYSESGGQMSDIGSIATPLGNFVVLNVQQVDGWVLHIGFVEVGSIDVDDRATLCVDRDHRLNTSVNHTVTHLLNATLEEFLGPTVHQDGSFVSPNYLRFSFTHNSKLSSDVLGRVEYKINRYIRNNLSVKTTHVDREHVGVNVKAVMTETHPPDSRLVTIGDSVSTELCCGTHVPFTGLIRKFVITQEESVGKNVRRIRAVTQSEATKSVCLMVEIENDIRKLANDTMNVVFRIEPPASELLFRAARDVNKLVARVNSRLLTLPKHRRMTAADTLQDLKAKIKFKVNQYEKNLVKRFVADRLYEIDQPCVIELDLPPCVSTLTKVLGPLKLPRACVVLVHRPVLDRLMIGLYVPTSVDMAGSILESLRTNNKVMKVHRMDVTAPWTFLEMPGSKQVAVGLAEQSLSLMKRLLI